MPDKVRLLHKLAGVVIDNAATEATLVQVADIIFDALGVGRAFLVYTGDGDFLVCGDSQSADGLGTNQMGLWLVQHQMEITGGPVAFDIQRGRVSDVVPATSAAHRSYIAMPIDFRDGSSEMLIVKGLPKWEADRSNLLFLEAAMPAVALILGRALSAVRAERQREQMMALANAAELLLQAEDLAPVLEDLATAISHSTGYDLVTIDVYDAATQRFNANVLNRTPQVETSLGETWRRMLRTGKLYPDAILRLAIENRQSFVVADLQNDERIPGYGREFFKKAHIFSAAQFPITFHDEPLGVLRVGSQRPRSFSPREVEALNGFSAQLAVALKAVEMYKSLAESEKVLKLYADELRSSMEVQHRLARTDALTGIPNRRYADEVVKGECSRAIRHKTHLCVALADVDCFKTINDTWGHKAGDEALVQLSDLARRTCRAGDVVGRYGGDEFLFVLPETDLPSATKFANRFRAAVAKHIFILASDAATTMRVSIGVVELDYGSGQKGSALIKAADEGMYLAKASGGNRTCSAWPSQKAA